MLGFTREHGRHQLVVHQPSRRVAHANVALELQRCHPCLGLTDQVDGQKPLRQRQLGAVKQRSGGQRGLAMTGVALEQRARAAGDHAVGTTAAARADEPVPPACTAHRLFTCRLGAEALEKLGQRQALLELDRVVGHCINSLVDAISLQGQWLTR